MCNSLQDIVLTTFGMHRQTDQTDRQTVQIHNASGHYIGRDIKTYITRKKVLSETVILKQKLKLN